MVKLKNGDVVQLKSGGPKMTIVKYGTMGNDFQCAWFVAEEVKKSDFTEESLELATDTNVTLNSNK